MGTYMLYHHMLYHHIITLTTQEKMRPKGYMIPHTIIAHLMNLKLLRSRIDIIDFKHIQQDPTHLESNNNAQQEPTNQIFLNAIVS